MPRLRDLVRRQTELEGQARQTEKESGGRADSISFPKQVLESARDLGTEKGISEEIYNEALSLVKEVLEGKSINGRRLNEVVTSVANRLLVKDVLLLNLVNRSTTENYLYAHSVNTCILAMTVGLGFGYNKSKLVELGVACLLHDIGMVKVLDIVSKGSKLTPEEYIQVKEHTFHGAEMLSQAEDIEREISQIVVREHHERYNGMGYPQGIKKEEIKEYARIVAVVDVYEALTHWRSYREKMQAHHALKEMVEQSDRLFEPDVVKALINQLTIYPVGSLVNLSSDEIARVAAVNKDFPLRPVVNIIFDKKGRPLDKMRSIDLSQTTGYHIKGPVDER